jgi:hypothetical protein
MNMGNECIMYYFDNQLHIKEIYSDTIFKITQDGNYLSKYTLELGKFNIPEKIREWSFDRFLSSIGKDFFLVNNIFESNKYLIFCYMHDNKDRLLVFNKKTGEIENFIEKVKLGFIKNDFDGGPYFFPVSNDNNQFLQMINAFELIAHTATDEFKNSTPKYPEKKKELEELAASLNENDNPVLMLVKLKQ